MITFAEIQSFDDTETKVLKKGDKLYRREGRRFVQIEIVSGESKFRDDKQADLFQEN